MLTTKAEMGTKMFWISTFLCNDFTNSSTQYTILHITQIHVFMTCHHWGKAGTIPVKFPYRVKLGVKLVKIPVEFPQRVKLGVKLGKSVFKG